MLENLKDQSCRSDLPLIVNKFIIIRLDIIFLVLKDSCSRKVSHRKWRGLCLAKTHNIGHNVTQLTNMILSKIDNPSSNALYIYMAIIRVSIIYSYIRNQLNRSRIGYIFYQIVGCDKKTYNGLCTDINLGLVCLIKTCNCRVLICFTMSNIRSNGAAIHWCLCRL